MLKASIVNIGDEILSGNTLNTNAHEMAGLLKSIGVQIEEMITVSDEEQAILNGLEAAFGKVQLVLVTGGLGPTHDDITKKVIARFFNRSMYFDEEVYQEIKTYFNSRNLEIGEAHKTQSYMPEGTTFIENKEGTAPGMWLEEEGNVLIAMPGVPREMRYIMSHGVIPKISANWNLLPLKEHTFRTFGVMESKISSMIQEVIADSPGSLKIAFLPELGDVKVRLTQMIKSKESDEAFQKTKEQILQRIAPHVYSENGESKSQVLGRLLREKSMTIATAESCTGGKLASQIVSVSGASQYFLGSLISYQNELKESWLNVKGTTLERHGAVSEPVVQEMLLGLLHHSKADIGVSISGIAGPSGGSPEKPVGTIWIAWGTLNNIKTKKLQLWKNREKNIAFTCSFCLNVLIKFLKNC